MAGDIEQVLSTLTEILEDTTLPKGVRQAIKETLETLQKAHDKVTINRALSRLEEVADNINMQPDHRTQLFNVVSMLEGV